MSAIIDTARAIMALIQPETGERATGTVKMVATSSDVTVPRNTFLVPILGNQHRPDLVFKVGAGPNRVKGDACYDKNWTVTSSGTDVDVLSNIGGIRHNLAGATKFVFDPPLSGISEVVSTSEFTGGTNPTGLGGIQNVVMYEQFDGPSKMVDLARSSVRAWPCVLIAWQGSEPADGSATSQVAQRTRTGTAGSLQRELFEIVIISERVESDHMRRLEGLTILDQITQRITHRRGVDGGQPVSNPSGLQIRQRYRDNGPQDIYQKFYVYGIRVSCMVAFTQLDERSPSLWEIANFQIIKPQDPALPNQGDYTLVDGAVINDDSGDTFVVDDATQEPIVDDETGYYKVED